VQVEVLQRDAFSQRLRIRCDLPRVQRVGGGGERAAGRYFRLSGAGLHAEPGEPVVPVVSRVVALPFRDTPVHVQVEVVHRSAVDLGPEPVPVLGRGGLRGRDPLLAAGEEAEMRLVGSPRTELLPANPYRIERLCVDGLYLARISFYPLAIRPASGAAILLREVELRVSLERPRREPAAAVLARGPLGGRWDGLLLNPDAARRWRRNRGHWVAAAPAAPAGPMGMEDAPVLRVLVDRDGMTVLSGSEIASTGISLRDVDLSTLALSERGQPEPILIEAGADGRLDAEDRILFYGRAPRGEGREHNPYTTENVYFLTWGGAPGARMIQEDASPFERDPSNFIEPSAFRWTVHVEEDSVFSRLGQNGTVGLDHWFWRTVRAPSLTVLPLDLPSPDALGDRATARVRLMGATFPPEYPDHHLEVYFNSNSLDDLTFDGQIEVLHEYSDLPMSALRDGGNEISLVAPGDTPAGTLDEVFVDWVEVEYDRLFEAADGVLAFAAPLESPEGLYQFRLKGFDSPDVRVFKLGVGEMVNGVVQRARGSGQYEVTIQDALVTSDVRYFALEADRFNQPSGVELVVPGPDLRDPARAAELLVIAPREFEETLQPYLDWRRAQGIEVNLSIAEDISHQFGSGLASPEAVRSCIRMAMKEWRNPSLESVLLVGDGTWDFRNIQQGDSLENRIPAGMDYNVVWGYTSSDNWYVLPQDDAILPALPIGRWTVRTIEELEAVIAKVVSYPQSGDWCRVVEVIGGNGQEFRDRGEELIRQIPRWMKPQRVYTTKDPERENDPHFRGGPELTRDIDEGALILNFQGHGGGGVWSDADLLDIEDVPLLRNGSKLPIVFSMTCYTGSFADPGPAAIGEVFLTEADKGAIAFFGSSGFSYEAQGHELNQQLFAALFDPGREDRSLGAAVVHAKQRFYLENDGLIPRDIVRAYNLLGDPWIVPAVPEEAISVAANPQTVALGGVVAVDGNWPGSAGGTPLTLELFDSDEELRDQARVNVDAAGDFSAQLTVPVGERSGTWSVRARGEHDYGGCMLGVEVPVLAELTTDPAPVRAHQPVHIRTEVSAGSLYTDYDLVWTINSLFNNADTLQLIPDGVGGAYVTNDTIPGQLGGREVFMKVLASRSDGDSWVGAVNSYKVLRREDLTFADGPQGRFTGTSNVLFGVNVTNVGQVDASSVGVRFSWYPVVMQADTVYMPGADEWREFEPTSEVRIEAPGKSVTRAEIQWDLPPGPQLVRVVIDPDDQVEESSEANNTRVLQVSADHYLVTPEDGTEGPRPSADGNLHVEVQAGVVSTPTVLVVERQTMPEPTAQGDYELPTFYSGAQGIAYYIHPADSSITLRGIDVTFHADGAATTDLAAYRWDLDRSKWIRYPSESRTAGDIQVENLDLGVYTLLDNHDQVPPQVELQARGRRIAEGGYVIPRPRLDLLAQDANGIDVRPEKIVLRLDGTTLDPTGYSVAPNPQHPNLVAISAQTELGRGSHEAELEIEDVNGNKATSATSFLIGEKTRIRNLANYPNPAGAAGTTFTFTLETDWAAVDEVTLRIYTPSGRMIRAFSSKRDLIRAVDYSEVPWDLADATGRPVANGVYFYRVEVKGAKHSERISRMGKLAVLR
jgi:hypothetical protein